MTAPARAVAGRKPTTLRLYEAADALLDVRAWIDEHAQEIVEAGGELPPALAELLDLAEGQFEAKVESVALYIRELLGTATVIEAEASRLTARARALTKAAEALKNGYLKAQLERAGVTKVQRPLATVRIQRNSQPTIVLDKTLLPLGDMRSDPRYAPFVREKVEYAIDSAAVYDARFNSSTEIGPELAKLPAGISCEYHSHVRIA